MVRTRKRLDLSAAFAFRRREGHRRDPHRMWRAASGASLGPTDRPQCNPAVRRAETGAKAALPLRTVVAPDFLVFAVLETAGGTASRLDVAALAAAHHLADEAYGDGTGAVAALCRGRPDGLDRSGADRVIALPETDGYRADGIATYVRAVLDTLRPRHVVFPETPAMRDTAARLAASIGERPAMGVHGFDGRACVRRGFGGAKDLRQDAPFVMTVVEDCACAVSGERFEARLLRADEDRAWQDGKAGPVIEDLGLETVPADRIALEEAPFILSAGAGVSDWDAFASVAERLNATCAGTRVVCDLGRMSRDRQVGASGRIVDADCYVAFGLSGAVQHLQGIESCGRVVAVNVDAAAPIMRRADLAIVGDANAILRALDKTLEAGGP